MYKGGPHHCEHTWSRSNPGPSEHTWSRSNPEPSEHTWSRSDPKPSARYRSDTRHFEHIWSRSDQGPSEHIWSRSDLRHTSSRSNPEPTSYGSDLDLSDPTSCDSYAEASEHTSHGSGPHHSEHNWYRSNPHSFDPASYVSNPHPFELTTDTIYDRKRGLQKEEKVIRKPFKASLDVIPVQYCIPPDVLVGSTASRLTELALHNTSLTREGFVHILRLSPSLQKIDLTTSSILTGGYIDMTGVNGTNSLYDMDLGSDYSCLLQEEGVEEVMVDETVIKWKPFRHQGVIELAATLQEIFDLDPNVRSPSLLRHFPRLQELYFLSAVGFSASSSAAVEELVTNAFENLSEVRFEHHNYTVGVFHGLLHHDTTLHTIMTYADREISFDTRQLEPVADAFREHGRVVQLPLQSLPLKTVCLYQHEMKIEWMEERPWRDTLEELTVRIEGLDTEQKIEKTLTLWEEC
ncbi:MAG: hypothetical protein J3R72DRAFT_424378 [Linnemannia gamsii]|nr:MAG: hypothetical protein J3R72DRAFT_424378 [Linnemannia gamsii]